MQPTETNSLTVLLDDNRLLIANVCRRRLVCIDRRSGVQTTVLDMDTDNKLRDTDIAQLIVCANANALVALDDGQLLFGAIAQ